MALPNATVPTLTTGDRMSGAEFHRRYLLWPDTRRAELIDGVVYVASPTRFDVHDERVGIAILWLGAYITLHPGPRAGGSATTFLGPDTEVQADAFLFRPDALDRVRVDAAGYIHGAPDLVVEVAASSANYDLREKKEAYRRNGVPEYVVWLVLDEAFDWFVLRDGEYVLVEADADGVIESAHFPGLRLHVPAMLAGDRARILAEVGLAL